MASQADVVAASLAQAGIDHIFGVPGSAAIGYSILVHTAQFFTQVILGVVFLAREGLSIRDLSNLKEEAGEVVS